MRAPTEKFVLGTAQFGLNYGINNLIGKPSDETIWEILNYAFDTGIEILDTADAYGRASELIGSFHSETRKKFKVNTKFICEEKIGVTKQLEQSLKELSVDQINVLFYHHFDDLKNYKNVFQELKGLKSEKLINKIGVSVYNNTDLNKAIETEEIDCIQLPFNLLDNYHQRGEFLKKAKERNKEVQVRSVFLQGLFFKDLNNYPDYLKPLKKYVQEIKIIAEAASKSMQELALGYVLAEDTIDYLVIGVDTKAQLENNIICSGKYLSNDTKKKIDNIAVLEIDLLYPYNWK